MTKRFAIAVAALTLGGSGAALAAQYPTVDFGSWRVTTIDGNTHTGIAPQTTFRHCASNPAKKVCAVGDYKHATVGQTYRTTWYVNGALASTAVYSWDHAKGTHRYSLRKKSGKAIPDGRYELLLSHNGHVFADTWLKLGTKKKNGKPC